MYMYLTQSHTTTILVGLLAILDEFFLKVNLSGFAQFSITTFPKKILQKPP